MKRYITLITLFAILKSSLPSPVTDSGSLVVTSTENSLKEDKPEHQNETGVNPQIYSMQIRTNITNRFATTLITSKVRNLKDTAEETTFAVILPENAFISEFIMEIDGKEYKAYVKEKQEAKRIYEEARASGWSAAHVELSARNAKTFKVSVNIEPEGKTIFNLKYEELLQRQVGQYELVVNIHPGQIVDYLDVEVYVNETRPLTFVQTPSLRTGNEISKNEDNLKPSTDIDIINATSAVVKFHPDKNEQKKFAGLLGTEKERGLSGQFVVQYDVERDPQGGEVLVKDGYFVHFFAPSELEPLPKHVVFVLDHSGSMTGRKIEQLTEAMQNILSELKAEDVFNIVRFSDAASVWNITENAFQKKYINEPKYGHLEAHLRELNVPEAVEVNSESIAKAKEVVKDQGDMSLTNIIAGLEVGLFLVKKTQEKTPNKYQPMIIFLTDGLPNYGMFSSEEIIETVTKLNSGENRASIFSLSFGTEADKRFLQLLSKKNLGFSRHIFEAADASLQLQDFYRKISSPLLKNVTFKYVDGISDLTRKHYPLFFEGSELVVAGRTNNIENILLDVNGIGRRGLIQLTPVKKEPISSIERLWAYLTVQQLLKDAETGSNAEDLKKKALDLALKYSFVTDVTSLVVVKPNQTESNAGQPGNSNVPEYSSIRDRISSLPVPYYSMRSGAAGMRGMSGPSHYKSPASAYFAPNTKRLYNSLSISSSAVGRRRLVPIPRPQRPYFTTPRTTVTTPATTTSSSAMTPQWLEDLQTNNQNVTTPQGAFLLGKSGDDISNPTCPKTPLNESGECKIIFDCPQVFSLLTDFNTYLQYFCPLNEYAGVCCPTSVPVP